MNKRYFSIFLCAVMAQSLIADSCSTNSGCSTTNNCGGCCGDSTSKSYLNIRPLGHSMDPILVSAFKRDFIVSCDDGFKGAVQGVIYGGKTTKADDFARYFFPFCKGSLVFGEPTNTEDGAIIPGPNPFDILASNFNVFTQDGTFSSTVSIAPEQTLIAGNIHYRHRFYEWTTYNRGFWASLLIPIQRVRNNLHLTEVVTNDGGGATTEPILAPAYGNMIAALNQSDWLYGKLSPCSQHETRVADLEFKIGYEWIDDTPASVETYIGMWVPTGNTPTGKYMFEPIVGAGGAWGFMFGSTSGIRLWDNDDWDMHLRVEVAGNSLYLFNNTQRRSVDLKNRPWSRYLPVYINVEQALLAQEAEGSAELSTPGINVFTPLVRTKSNFASNMTTSFILTWAGFHAEGGYNFYARRAECLELACPFPTTIALKDIGGGGFTNPIRDITGNYFKETIVPVPVDQYNVSVIQASDLDLDSAATPAVLSHMVYGSVGYNFEEICEYPIFVNAGGTYEFGNSNNAAPDRWVLWIKGGIAF